MQNSSPSTSNGYCWPTKATRDRARPRFGPSARSCLDGVFLSFFGQTLEQWLRLFLCWLELLRGSALGFQKLANYMAPLLEAGGVRLRLHPQMREPLILLPPASRHVVTISLLSMASTGGGQDGTRALQNRRRRRAYTTPATRSAATYTSNHQKGKDPPAQLRSVE